MARAAELTRRGEPIPDELRRSIDHELGRFRPKLVAITRRLVADGQAAEEVAQDAIADAWRKLAEFEGGSFHGWVIQFARHKAANRRRKWTELLTEDGDPDPPSEEVSTLSALTRLEREHVFALARARLPRLEQDVLFDFGRGMSYAEIDASRGLPGTGARNVLAKARRRLLAYLREELERLGHGSSFFRTTTLPS